MKKTTGQDRKITQTWRPATKAIRGGTWRSEQGETSEALFLNSGYSYDDAETVAARFAGEAEGMTYSRLQNPTVAMLEERIALLEGAEACRAQASGMAAMTTALLCQLRAGDHVIAARVAFGSCRWLVDNLLPRYGIETTIVSGSDLDAWAAAVRPNTKLFFYETPANPTMDLVNIAGLSDLARAHNIRTVVDNAFATSALQRPLELGADIVAYSATKLMDGQGRVLAGAVCGSEEFMEEELLPFQRNTGPVLSPFNAWVVLKSLETLDLRAKAQSAAALELARFLEGEGLRVHYPGLESHPQHQLAKAQMSAYGSILSFVLPGRQEAFAVLDALELIDISNNIGDSRSLMCHPASTTHSGLEEEERRAMGIGEGMLRLSIGLEDVSDLMSDITQALSSSACKISK